MSHPARSTPASRRSSSYATLAIFLVGVPIGYGVLHAISLAPAEYADWKRYFTHPVEWAEVVLFCCAISAIVGKLFVWRRERAALNRSMLAPWDGKPVAAADARKLRDELRRQPEAAQATYLGRRIDGILDFVLNRGSASDLDDQIRTLADNDAMAMEGSYSLIRFISWAIPILGFLGTVLGITGAVANIDPDSLNLKGVTGGLADAFDTTALALLLTMVLMFFQFSVERMEQGVLDGVDQIVDSELTHRFKREGKDNAPFIDSLKENTHVLLHATQLLVEKQATLWTSSMDKAEAQWTQTGARQQDKMAASLQQALESTLQRHGERLVELEANLLTRNHALLEGLNNLADTLHATGREHQLALARLTDSLGMQIEMLAKVQASEAQLVRLQEALSQNLGILANANTLDQAVQSMTAAIHLLTTRVSPQQQPLRVVGHHAA